MHTGPNTESSTQTAAPLATKKRGAKTRAAKQKTDAAHGKETLHLKSKNLSEHAVDPVEVDALRTMIATAAYFRAEQRGFAPGHELDDWLQAERSIRTQLPS